MGGANFTMRKPKIEESMKAKAEGKTFNKLGWKK